MKWFKHMANSSLDEKIARFTDKYGLEAYGFFWRVLEAIAENVDETDRNHVEYSTKTWCKLLGIRPQTFRKLISESSVLGLFEVSFNSDLVSVKSNNILKYRDEWTSRKRKTPELLKEEDTDTEEDKDKDPLTPKSIKPKSIKKQNPNPEDKNDFAEFWAAYPRKTSKAQAAIAWNKANGKPPLEELLAILERHKASRDWQKDDGQFVPYASTWLNQQRWSDEIEGSGHGGDQFAGAI